ncbi:hypothetical protein RB199_23605 [Streptomyces libani]
MVAFGRQGGGVHRRLGQVPQFGEAVMEQIDEFLLVLPFLV